jgi:hypothetical protein
MVASLESGGTLRNAFGSPRSAFGSFTAAASLEPMASQKRKAAVDESVVRAMSHEFEPFSSCHEARFK